MSSSKEDTWAEGQWDTEESVASDSVVKRWTDIDGDVDSDVPSENNVTVMKVHRQVDSDSEISLNRNYGAGKAAVRKSDFKLTEEEINIDNLSVEQTKKLLKSMYKKIQELEKKVQSMQIKDRQREDKMKSQEDRSKIAIKAIINHDQRLQNINSKMVQQESHVTRNNLIVSGIKETKEENCKEIGQWFFKNKLKMQNSIVIKDAH